MPLIFSLIFGNLQSGGTEEKSKIALVESNTEIGKELFTLLKQNDKYEWETVSLEIARELVSEQEVIAAVVIPDDAETRLEEEIPLFNVIVYQETEDYLALSPYLEGTALSVYQVFNDVKQVENAEFIQVLKEMADTKIIDLVNTPVKGLDEKKVDLTPLGFTIMFMMFGITSLAASIHTERTEKTWQRLVTSSISSFQLLTGYVFSFFIIGWIQLGTLMLVMKLVFKVDWGNLLYLIPFASLTILLIVGFGIMIASLTKTKKQTEIFNAVLIVSTCMLGGIYWPLDIVPSIMQQISKFVPQTWMISGFGEIMSGNLSPSIFKMDILVLSIFTLVFLVIGLRNLKRATY